MLLHSFFLVWAVLKFICDWPCLAGRGGPRLSLIKGSVLAMAATHYSKHFARRFLIDFAIWLQIAIVSKYIFEIY